MGIRDILKKKQGLDDGDGPDPATVTRLAAPEFRFVRTDTYTEERIYPPGAGGDRSDSGEESPSHLAEPKSATRSRLSLDVFRSSRSRSESASSSKSGDRSAGGGGAPPRRLSQRLHLSRSPVSSDNVPTDLPEIVVPGPAEGAEDQDGHHESQWEKRATMLARKNEENRTRPPTPVQNTTQAFSQMSMGGGSGGEPTPLPKGTVSSKAIDEDIQEAIRLHEAGDLERSTALFGKLADPKGANNPLSQVLYGLALRYASLSVRHLRRFSNCRPIAAADCSKTVEGIGAKSLCGSATIVNMEC